ncbi:glycosyltransferase [Buchananella felis]|uniref:glycosyltransferase n=1 Tax=Buchananella felis TaxID=3231492 RepID=UPI00352865AD
MSQSPRVVIASRIWAPEPAAAAFRLSALRRALLEAGAKVRVLTAARPAKLAGAECDERGVSRAPVLRDKNGYIQGFLPYFSFDLPLFWRLLFAKRADVVVSELPPTTGFMVRAACKLRRIPYVYYAADLWEEAARAGGYPPIAEKVIGWVERRVLAGAARTLAVAPQIAQSVTERGGHPELVWNGVDTDQFTPDGPVEQFDAPTFLYAGTAGNLQGAVIFAKAFARVLEQFPTARLVFYGQGEEFPAIRAELEKLPAQSWEINGHVSPDRISELMRGATAALASIAPGDYSFAMPSKAFAAGACGTRVLRVGEKHEERWPAHLLGPVVEYDVAAVAAAMVDLLSTADECKAQRVAWVRENASLRSVGRLAAAKVLEVAAR